MGLLIIFCLILTACAPTPTEPVLVMSKEPPALTEETTKEQVVFSYGKSAKEIVLRLNAEPSLLGEQLVRLAGVVGFRAAVVEVVGRGRAIKVGSDILGYRATEIGHDYIKLEGK